MGGAAVGGADFDAGDDLGAGGEEGGHWVSGEGWTLRDEVKGKRKSSKVLKWKRSGGPGNSGLCGAVIACDAGTEGV
jgi:hypothetical protein